MSKFARCSTRVFVGLTAAVVIAAMLAWPAESQDEQVIDVGPDEFYQVPSEAANVVRDGYTIRIAPGDYVDCASWRANDLTIIAPEGDVTVRDRTCEGKAIWVISGNDITVDGITFTGAAVPDRNGAGIRAEGRNLTVRNSRFIENENGILAATIEGSTITVENSEFMRNGFEHGIYANRIARLVVRNSVFREHRIRHHIKSRALVTEVYDSIIEDGPDGNSSYLIEAPNGGTLTVRGNRLQKGPNTDNPGTAIGIGFEGVRNPSDGILVEENVFVNDGPSRAAFVRNRSETPAILRRNRLQGSVEPLVGPGELVP
ncbi:MAG: hypothetical protein GVY13_08820 [Alphaproteobacteria bacterium]|jgi:hypothetical protein|nr:hypothetical protein [Alphaproteobacteria bacterium]